MNVNRNTIFIMKNIAEYMNPIIKIISKIRTHFIDFPCSPIQYPWFKISEEYIPVIHLHRLIFDWQWKNQRKIMFLQAFLWPLKSFLVACKIVIKYGKDITEENIKQVGTVGANPLFSHFL